MIKSKNKSEKGNESKKETRRQKIKIEKVSYAGWRNCYKLSNNEIEIIATCDIGPRIIFFGFIGRENEFGEYKEHLGKTGGDKWRIYGGHRLWHAPEAKPRTYYPDNFPVKAHVQDNILCLEQAIEPTTNIKKEIEIALSTNRSCVKVHHKLTNKGLWSVELSVWALTVMAQNGVAVIPQEPYAPHSKSLTPVRPLVLWSYTNMADNRWNWGEKYITLQQSPGSATPQKVGMLNKQGWISYIREQNPRHSRDEQKKQTVSIFIKRFKFNQNNLNYPDFGCNVETFTNADMLELETLSPLTMLEPECSITHTEYWFLFEEEKFEINEKNLDKILLPKIKLTDKYI